MNKTRRFFVEGEVEVYSGNREASLKIGAEDARFSASMRAIPFGLTSFPLGATLSFHKPFGVTGMGGFKALLIVLGLLGSWAAPTQAQRNLTIGAQSAPSGMDPH